MIFAVNVRIRLLKSIVIPAALTLTCISPPPHLEEYRLKGSQAVAWQKIENNFNRNAFIPCLADKGITVSCSGCTGVILRGVITIDRNGNYTEFQTSFERYCGSPMPREVKECLLNFFQDLKFPPELRGITIDVDLGRALKC